MQPGKPGSPDTEEPLRNGSSVTGRRDHRSRRGEPKRYPASSDIDVQAFSGSLHHGCADVRLSRFATGSGSNGGRIGLLLILIVPKCNRWKCDKRGLGRAFSPDHFVWLTTKCSDWQSQCSSAVEQRFRKPSVAGSIPAIGSIFQGGIFLSQHGLWHASLFLLAKSSYRSADCA